MPRNRKTLWKAGAGLLCAGLGLSKEPKDLRDGKEDSYERNPGGVSFVFNHKFFALQKVRKTCSSLPKRFFRRAAAGAGLFCAGLCYGLVLIPLGVRIPCLFYCITGLRCPGCGVTDLCLALLHGRFLEAAGYNWGLVLASPVLVWLVVRLWRKSACGKAETTVSAALLVFLLAWGVVRNIWGL